MPPKARTGGATARSHTYPFVLHLPVLWRKRLGAYGRSGSSFKHSLQTSSIYPGWGCPPS